jgi:hypothetical protein
MENSNGGLKLKRKLKDGYAKLTLFKVWIHFFKSDEKLRVISEISQKNKETTYTYPFPTTTKYIPWPSRSPSHPSQRSQIQPLLSLE